MTDTIIEEFCAACMRAVLVHRQVKSRFSVQYFRTEIERELARTLDKLDANDPRRDKLSEIAERAIARAERDGEVLAFEPPG